MIGLKVKNDIGEEREYWDFWVEVDESLMKDKYLYYIIGQEATTKGHDIIKVEYDIKKAISLKNELKEKYKKMLKGE